MPFHTINVNMRRERDAHGKFVTLPGIAISADNGWVTMRPGEVVTHHVILDLAANRGWKEALVVGNHYWLKYGVNDRLISKPPELINWRFGTIRVSRNNFPPFYD